MKTFFPADSTANNRDPRGNPSATYIVWNILFQYISKCTGVVCFHLQRSGTVGPLPLLRSIRPARANNLAIPADPHDPRPAQVIFQKLASQCIETRS